MTKTKKQKNKKEFFDRPHTLVKMTKRGAYGFLDKALLDIGADPSYIICQLFKGVNESDSQTIHQILSRCFFAGVNAYRKNPSDFEFDEKANFEYEYLEEEKNLGLEYNYDTTINPITM